MHSSLHKIKNNSKEVDLKRILQDKRKRVRLTLLLGGILLVAAGLFTSSESEKKITSATTFSLEPVKIDGSLLKDRKLKESKPPVRIIIPDLDIDLPVKEAKIIEGYWEVFSDTAGFGAGSAYPDEVGNTVIFAHARKGLFLPLKKAVIGQKVYVFTQDRWFSYTISDIKEVLPTQTGVISPTKEPVLTLYTCSGFSDSKRLIVVGKRD